MATHIARAASSQQVGDSADYSILGIDMSAEVDAISSYHTTTGSQPKDANPNFRTEARALRGLVRGEDYAVLDPPFLTETVTSYMFETSAFGFHRYECLLDKGQCGVSFSSRSQAFRYVRRHLYRKHFEDLKYQCNTCLRCFRRPQNLRNHLEQRALPRDLPETCLCCLQCARNEALTRHRERGICRGAPPGEVSIVQDQGKWHCLEPEPVIQGSVCGSLIDNYSKMAYETRGRSRQATPVGPSRNSSCSSVRSMIDERMQMADAERGRSRVVDRGASASPFRSGSEFEQEYADSRRSSVAFDVSDSFSIANDEELGNLSPTSEDRCRSQLCGKSHCATFRGNDPLYAATFGGLTGFTRHIQRWHRNFPDTHYCPYCDEKFSTGSKLCLHVLGDHQCAYCENEEPYKDREDLKQHLEEQHLCRNCWLFMGRDALAAHACEAEVTVSIETCEDANGNITRARDAEEERSKTRTPSFSPPYMRPGVRRGSFSAFRVYLHRRSISPRRKVAFHSQEPSQSVQQPDSSQTSLSSAAVWSTQATQEANSNTPPD